MRSEDMKALVNRYVDEVLNRGNFDLLSEICAPDYKRYLSPAADPLTLGEQRTRLATIRTAFPTWELSVKEIICEGDVAAFRAVVHGTQTGPFLGLPATGKSFSISALDMVLVRDGQFVEHWGGPDLFALTQQLGAEFGLDD